MQEAVQLEASLGYIRDPGHGGTHLLSQMGRRPTQENLVQASRAQSMTLFEKELKM
jgi:hypothetical protein